MFVQGKYLFTGGKEGAYYLLKADALGGYNKNNNNGNAWQTIPPAAASNKSVSVGAGGIYSGAAYWPVGACLSFIQQTMSLLCKAGTTSCSTCVQQQGKLAK